MAAYSVERLLCRRDPAAPGYRNNTTGELNGVGNEGSSWAATAVDIRGHRLIFNAGLLEPERLSNRSGGYQVRCLQAFIGRTRLPLYKFML